MIKKSLTGRTPSEPEMQFIRPDTPLFQRTGQTVMPTDYSSLETRVLASMASVDVHRQTADELGVTRAEAKIINWMTQWGVPAQKAKRMAESVLMKRINAMTHYELAELWRFGESGDATLQGEYGDRVKERLFTEFGGFTPEISKQLGWRKK